MVSERGVYFIRVYRISTLNSMRGLARVVVNVYLFSAILDWVFFITIVEIVMHQSGN